MTNEPLHRFEELLRRLEGLPGFRWTDEGFSFDLDALTRYIDGLEHVAAAARVHRDIEDRHYGTLTEADNILYAALEVLP